MSTGKLGKGLSALIGNQSIIDNIINDKKEPSVLSKAEKTESLSENIQLNLIVADRKQPRKCFNDDSLKELGQSIRSNGILQPIIVRVLNDGKYKIISGERRFRASTMLGLKSIPAIIRNVAENEALEIGIIENLQREDLNPIEEGFAYKDLINEFGYTQEHLSKRVGKSRSYITNLLRVLSLPKSVRNLLSDGKISLGHCKLLVGNANAEKISKKIVKDGLSVRQTESLISGKVVKPKHIIKISDHMKAEVEEIKMLLSKRLNLKTNVKLNGEKGKIEISFKNLKELDSLISIINNS